jgi:uncharacterized protein YaeQ
MATYIWLNVPIMAVIFAAMCGIPLWMVIKRPDTGREIKEAARRAEAIPLHAVSRHEAERWRESAAA